jgi:hypothetical protein
MEERASRYGVDCGFPSFDQYVTRTESPSRVENTTRAEATFSGTLRPAAEIATGVAGALPVRVRSRAPANSRRAAARGRLCRKAGDIDRRGEDVPNLKRAHASRQ